MEFLEGETLDEVLTRRKRLPSGEAVRLVQQALNGLQHLHERRMIHRDLKPANLMLTPAAGKPDTTLGGDRSRSSTSASAANCSPRTPRRARSTRNSPPKARCSARPITWRPEQARDARNADIRADIYSIGCVLYHCLTGRPPFPESNIMTQMLKHATEKPVPLASLADDVPPGLQTVIDRMLAKSPDDRFATPAEAAEALTPFLVIDGTAPKPRPHSYPSSGRGWRLNRNSNCR